jgi:hypothetical protein
MIRGIGTLEIYWHGGHALVKSSGASNACGSNYWDSASVRQDFVNHLRFLVRCTINRAASSCEKQERHLA